MDPLLPRTANDEPPRRPPRGAEYDQHSMEAYAKLVERTAEVQDIAGAAAVLAWDQRTKMPEAGARARADQLATLTRLAYERFTAPEIGGLLDEVEAYGESLDFDSLEASLIRVTRRDYDKACRVPVEL